MSSFADLIAQLAGTGPTSSPPAAADRHTLGIVTAINSDGTLAVAIDGNATGVPATRLASARSLAVGDEVFLVVTNNVLVVFDKLATAAYSDIGMVVAFSTAPPPGWLICDGSTFSATTYPALHAALGTTSLPNCKGSFLIGANGTYTLGASFGAPTVTLTTSNLPSHNHAVTITDPEHLHGPGEWQFVATTGGGAPAAGNVMKANSAGTSSAATGISATTANVGSGTDFSIIPPAVAVNWCIRAL